MVRGRGEGCAFALAVFFTLAAIALFAFGLWGAAWFVGLAAALFWAGFLDPG